MTLLQWAEPSCGSVPSFQFVVDTIHKYERFNENYYVMLSRNSVVEIDVNCDHSNIQNSQSFWLTCMCFSVYDDVWFRSNSVWDSDGGILPSVTKQMKALIMVEEILLSGGTGFFYDGSALV